ncbi:Cysteine--tRNA ligase, mitochondrial [Orchesella cincta]|uniref:cysteine--tRNA ligase n=1 Tax=Orchesella cincta TaxID=48709 RepID=A0A1D2MW40_ORCCI|nr:Cysteine--tRNA ligase, mitochondrial [Orchesella cincta]
MLFPTVRVGLAAACGCRSYKRKAVNTHRSVGRLLFSSGTSLQEEPATKISPESLYDSSKALYNTPFVIFDTAKNGKCKLSTRRPNILTWYSCGPTVYDSAHIGHASSFIRQDVIRRILESLDKDLTIIQVMGITDIDDKIINRANQTGKEWNSVGKHYEQEFIEDLKNLNVIQPHIFTRVSDYIPQIIGFVGNLIKGGYAYPVSDGSVYFDTEKFGSRYGKFRQANSDSQEDEEDGTEFAGGKKSAKDFAVWKGAKPGEPFWESPWGTGKGRPGWHIECSVMATQIFGPNLDLHTGGKDLIFPHHENEEAQCCAHFDSSSWTSHWLHMGHLHFKGDVKMSKSLGNTVSISNFLIDYSPDVLRIMCILSKYRKNLEYSQDSIDNAKKVLKKFHTFANDTSSILDGSKPVNTTAEDAALWTKLESARTHLKASLLNDFDTPEAVKTLMEFISDFNRHHIPHDSSSSSSSSTNSNVSYELVLASRIFALEFLNLVGFQEFTLDSRKSKGGGGHEIPYENLVEKFVQFRNQVRSYSLALNEPDKQLRKQKIGERAELITACDNVRNQLLAENGVEIKDHGKSSSWSFTK